MVKVIASQVRKGNVLEDENGKLYVVLNAESFHPGKGTPTTQIDMRCIADGVKTTARYKTTDQVERAFVETIAHTYLYEDHDGFVCMNPETYDQITVPKSVMGTGAVYLTENMELMLSLHNGFAISVDLPQKVVLEVVDTEPALKGQTVSSSFKPAVLSNGVKTAVPPHIVVGTRIVVLTEDGSYVERAKE